MSPARRQGRCRSCNAPVLWARTERGRSMPLDPAPVSDGNVVILGWEPSGQPRVGVRQPDPDLPDIARYVSHFATCPNRAEHRRPR